MDKSNENNTTSGVTIEPSVPITDHNPTFPRLAAFDSQYRWDCCHSLRCSIYYGFQKSIQGIQAVGSKSSLFVTIQPYPQLLLLHSLIGPASNDGDTTHSLCLSFMVHLTSSQLAGQFLLLRPSDRSERTSLGSYSTAHPSRIQRLPSPCLVRLCHTPDN
ncbi:hypothetical protein M3J09_012892 [Ascochyta lentis]